MIKEKLAHLKVLAVGLAGSTFLRVLNWTLHWETVGLEGEKQFWPHGEPCIIAFWHGHQLLMPQLYLRGRRSRECPSWVALVSQHNDGRMMASSLRYLGVNSVTGSSSRRGTQAMFELIEVLRNGNHVAITPDGPKGPPFKLKGGVIRIAQRSGAPIYPAALHAENCWTFNSWDRMTLPKPFSRVVLVRGDKISVPAKLNAEELAHYSTLVENAINDVTKAAEKHKFA